MNIPSASEQWLSMTALKIIDLRAHFEAQLRLVTRGEEHLRKCRATQDAARAQVCAEQFRREMSELLKNNLAIRALLTEMTNEM